MHSYEKYNFPGDNYLIINASQTNLKTQTLRDTLMVINLQSYLNKPIDSIIQHLPQTYDRISVASANTVTQGAKVVLFYTSREDSMSFHIISIWPNTAEYITVLNTSNNPVEQKWPLELVSKEKAGYIEILDCNGAVIRAVY